MPEGFVGGDGTGVSRELHEYARRLVERHGPEARTRALKRRVQMEEIGHEPAAEVWRQILKAVIELLDGGTPPA